MECKGLVLGREGDRALVRVARTHCSECGACGLFAPRRERDVEFIAHNRADAEVGDEVLMVIPPRELLISYLLAFGLPLASMVAAYGLMAALLLLVGGYVPQGPAVAATIVAGAVFFWVGARLAGRKGLRPEITHVLGKGSPPEETGSAGGPAS